MPYRPKDPEDYRDEEWLREKYVDERLSMSQIGELCDCSKETIRRWLERHGIGTRSQSEATKAEWEHAPEERHNQAREHYRNLTPPHVERGYHTEETLEKMAEVKRGEKNPRWKGGYSRPQGPEWRGKRKQALRRDNHTCWGCGLSHFLHVHHVEPYRTFEDDEEAHRLSNLITVCLWCHPGFE